MGPGKDTHGTPVPLGRGWPDMRMTMNTMRVETKTYTGTPCRGYHLHTYKLPVYFRTVVLSKIIITGFQF